MEVSAILRDVQISPQKVRLVADQVRKMPVNKAIDILSFSQKKAAHILKKVVESAIANAEHNNGLDIDNLIISTVFVDEAPTLKRIRPRAKGRANRILKRSSHITVKVLEREE